MLGGAVSIKPIVVSTFLAFASMLVGCGDHGAASGPVPFEVTDLRTGLEASNTNALKITGSIRVRDAGFKDKAMLLRLGGTVSFKRAGVTKPVFAHDDQILITNGAGALELWFFVSPAEKSIIEPELASPTYALQSQGYTELKPVSLELR